jgi:hypothetical protein
MLLLLTTCIALAELPTAADLDQLWKQHDFAGVVKGASDALAPGGTTDAAERYKIAWLKGEAELQLRQADAAVDAFNAADGETHDERQMALAKATGILIGRSKDFVYTSLSVKPPQVNVAPRPAANLTAANSASTKEAASKPVVLLPGQFDIVDPRHREAAMEAMWKDERLDAEATIKVKIADKTLVSVNTALDRVHAAEPIAIAGGAADWPQDQKDKLANAARIAANTAMKDMNAALVLIIKDQNIRRNRPNPKPMPQGGRDQLNQMTKTLDDTTQTLKALIQPLNCDKSEFDSQLEHAATLEDRATTVLATD